jgi:molecular chaperone DnaK
VARADFENLIREKVESTHAPMLSALSDAQLSREDLDIVLLVGGSTRIPCVKGVVENALGIAPRALVDPELTVARGAAIQAGLMDGSIDESVEIVLTDVCPFTLGTAVLCGEMFDERLEFAPIIPRNTPVPTDVSEIYFPAHDYQTAVKVKVYQGESLNPENNDFLGELELSGIPAARTGKEPFEVTFSYDMNGILQVGAKVVSTGKEVSVVISTAGVSPLAAPDISKWEDAPGAKRFRPLLRKAGKYMAHRDIDEEDRDELSSLTRQIKEALVLERPEQAEALRDELLELLEIVGVGLG